jgi:hypothetical protein
MSEVAKGISELCDLVATLRDEAARLEAENERMREALEKALIGGNHIASQLIGRLGGGFSEDYPPDMDSETVLTRLGPTVEYDMWCAWSAGMQAREYAEAIPDPAGGMPVEVK